LRAVLGDAELARTIGLDIDRIVLLGVALGSGLAGAAAVLTSQDIDLVPTMGFDALLVAVVGAVVGGIGSVRGAAMGGFLVGLLRHVAVWKIPTQWQDGVLFLLLLCVLLLRPHGFLTTRPSGAT
jgi:branched-chain amino acid transport system permease protein